MPPLRATALLASCASAFGQTTYVPTQAEMATTAQTVPWHPYVDYLVTRADANGNGYFDSGTEFTTVITATNTTAEWSATWFSTIAGADNRISKNELVYYAIIWRDSGTALQAAWAKAFSAGLTGVDEEMSAEVHTENLYVTRANSLLTLSFEIQEESKMVPLGVRIALKNQLCQLIVAPSEAAFMTITTKGSAIDPASAATSRRLQTVTSTVFLKAYFYLAADAAAAEALAKTTLTSLSATNGYLSATAPTVTALTVPTFVTGTPFPKFTVDFGLVWGIVAMLIIFGILGCVLAGLQARRKRKMWGMEHKGCCSTGCCSSWSLRGWVLSAWMASLLLLIGSFQVMSAMQKVSDSIVCMADEILKTADLKGEAAEAGKAIDMDLINSIKEYAKQLPTLSMVPALLASIYLFVISLCYARNARTMKCAKLLSLILMGLLVVCFVFYILFAIISVAVSMDDVQKEIIKVTSVCDTTVPDLRQTLQDSESVMAVAATVPGANATETAELKEVYDNAVPAFSIFSQMCVCLNQIFFDFADLFVPAMLCVVFSAYAMWVIFTLCFVAKCCCSPTPPPGQIAPIA